MKQDWWVLYPYVGLTIKDSRGEMRNPMFGRYHIISPSHLKGIARYIKFDPVTGEDVTPYHSLAHIRTQISILGDGYDSLLAVRQAISKESNISDADPHPVHIFSSTIAIALFCNQLGISYCSLLKDLSKSEEEKWLAFNVKGKSISLKRNAQNTRTREIYIQNSIFKYHRRDLKKLLLSNDLSFGKILLSDTRVHSSFKLSLQTAILTLDNALRQRDLSLQLLGCVTVVDALFKGNANFKCLKRRISTILNNRTSYFLRVNEILKSRHAFVHEGKHVVDKDLAHKAVHLAIIAVVSFSNLAHLFKSKSIMFQQLDKIASLEDSRNSQNFRYNSALLKTEKKIRKQFMKLSKIEYTKHFVHRD